MDYDQVYELVTKEFPIDEPITNRAIDLAMLFSNYLSEARENSDDPMTNLYDFALYLVSVAFPDKVKTIDDLFSKDNKV